MRLSLIEKRVYGLAEKWVGKVNVGVMIRQLNLAFKRNIVHFSSEKFEGEYLEDHNVIVGGHYCPNMWAIPEHIYVCLSFPKGKKKPFLTEKGARNLALKIVRTIRHEYRHKYQQRQRPIILQKQYIPKKGQNKLKAMYYGNADELDAHAFETKADRIDLNKLRKAHKIGWRQSEALFMYRQTFRKHDPKVWYKFLKKVYKTNVEIQAVSKRRTT